MNSLQYVELGIQVFLLFVCIRLGSDLSDRLWNLKPKNRVGIAHTVVGVVGLAALGAVVYFWDLFYSFCALCLSMSLFGLVGGLAARAKARIENESSQ